MFVKKIKIIMIIIIIVIIIKLIIIIIIIIKIIIIWDKKKVFCKISYYATFFYKTSAQRYIRDQTAALNQPTTTSNRRSSAYVEYKLTSMRLDYALLA